MSEDLALLAAITANEMEDLPRLVYADWLEEHDEPELAAFVRLQVAVHRVPSVDPRRMELRTEEKAAWERYRRKWNADLTAGKIGRGHFSLGVLTKPATFTAAHFVDHSHRWAPGLPVRSLRLLHPTGLVDRIAGAAYLSRLPRLDIGPAPRNWWEYRTDRDAGKSPADFIGVPAETVIALCNCQMTEGVGNLTISGIPATRAMIEAVGECTGLGGIAVSLRTVPGRSWNTENLYPGGIWLSKWLGESFAEAVKQFLASEHANELTD